MTEFRDVTGYMNFVDRYDLSGGADYTRGNLVTCQRDDRQYTICSSLSYALSPHATLSLAYELDLGRNAQDGLVNSSTREYNRNLVSLATSFKW